MDFAIRNPVVGHSSAILMKKRNLGEDLSLIFWAISLI